MKIYSNIYILLYFIAADLVLSKIRGLISILETMVVGVRQLMGKLLDNTKNPVWGIGR